MTGVMKLFRFLDWQVYKDSKLFYKETLSLVKKLPLDLKSSLGNQILRSSLSVSLNIAEGCAKHSDKDFNHFLNIALGSLNETVAGLDILHDVGYLNQGDFERIIDLAVSITKQLGGFKKKLL